TKFRRRLTSAQPKLSEAAEANTAQREPRPRSRFIEVPNDQPAACQSACRMRRPQKSERKARKCVTGMVCGN
ncbi:MAG: hypothetical protein ACK4Q4_10535, partial [Rhodocyclaceae bacterium]